MKKLMPVVLALGLILVAAPVLAANNGVGAQGTEATTQTQQRLMVSPSPTGNQVKNQNQVKTQNEGEDSEIQTNTQEQENLEATEGGQGMPKEFSPRSETALEHMSNVAAQVEALLTTKTVQGGIGDQIKLIAQKQKEAQQEIQTELGKVDDRGGFAKFLIGPNYQAIKNMQQLMEQNQLRIQELTQLQNQLTNQAAITQVQEMIKALTDQNTALTERINLEEQTGSLFGWLLKLFAK